ncbi:MAG TPA: alpha-amylase family glycosyl hydrolase, partial [Planctomycetota bacterium]|nr:alpha-amylase family glycosyl hydrolase [Planctomycetota bacterium]
YQPEVNWRNPELKNAMFDVIKYWLDKGVDGFRLDVVNWYIKDAEFRSNPWHIQLSPPDLQRHLYDRNQPETHEICKQIRKIIDQYPNKTTVGEIYVENLQNHKAIAEYYGDNDQLHLVFNFGLMRAKWNAGKFHKQIQAWENTVPAQCQPTWTLSNHDQPRHYTRYKNSEERAKVAIALLLTLRGTPFLYYGEEIGMENNKIPRKKIQDPLGKTTWPFPLGRDPERTPMQWTPEQNAGFTTTTPWLPIHKNYIKKNVQTQQQDRDSLLNHYKQLIWLRKKTPTLHKGTYKTLQTKAKHYLAYQRIYQDTVTTIFLNFTKKQQTIQEWQQIFQNQTILFTTHPDKELNNTLQPYQILILHSDNPTTSTTE